jgi:hypothetical protein
MVQWIIGIQKQYERNGQAISEKQTREKAFVDEQRLNKRQ